MYKNPKYCKSSSVKSRSIGYFIISGCVPTLTPGVDIEVTSGYIWLDGEVVEVEAQTVADTSGTDLYEYVLTTTYDAGGTKTFIDSNTRQTWRKVRGIVTSVAALTPGEIDCTDTDRLREKIVLKNDWNEVGNHGGATTYLAGIVGDNTIFRRKLSYRLVEFSGSLSYLALNGSFKNTTGGALASGSALFTLPVGFRPSYINQCTIKDDAHNLYSLNVSPTGGCVFVSTGTLPNNAIVDVNYFVSLD